ILMEINAYRSYSELDFDINFWRTKSGMEVDFVLEKGKVAVEVKGSSRIDSRDLKSSKVFIEECSPKRAVLVCNEKEKRVRGKIEIMPWRDFLSELWSGNIL
ncbi:MAG: AAA family ATPase, partial [Candidatus Omnitrophica bacterium]|nr:AAA family ATPase [Candidatus Omnitrophota bacterium]